MAAFLSILFDMFGAVVGAVGISLALYTLYHYPEDYNQAYVAALFILGTLLLVLAGERPVSHQLTSDELPVVLGRALMYCGVAYWEVIIVRQNFRTESTLPHE